MNTFGTLAAEKNERTSGTAKEVLPRFLSPISDKNFKSEVTAKIDALAPLEPSYSFGNDDDGKKKAVGMYWKKVEQLFSAKLELKKPERKVVEPLAKVSRTVETARPVENQDNSSVSSSHRDSGDDN